MQIRPVEAADHATIAALLDAAFGGSDESTLVAALRAAGDMALERVAVSDDGAILGHIAYSRLKSPEGALALAPVAVLPARQRRGIGSALIRESLDDAARTGALAVFVLGDPAYYTRFGFSVAAAARFTGPYPAEYTIALALGDADLGALEPALIYAPAFDAVS